MNNSLEGALTIGIAIISVWAVPVLCIIIDKEERQRIGRIGVIGLLLIWIGSGLLMFLIFYLGGFQS